MLASLTWTPLPGKRQRYEYHYRRNGTGNLFMFFAPKAGWRHVEVTERRTKPDFARCMQTLGEGDFPEAEKSRVVLDNLTTHTPAALYEVFSPPEARRLLQRLEVHYPPKHGSWLKRVEIELSVLCRKVGDNTLLSTISSIFCARTFQYMV